MKSTSALSVKRARETCLNLPLKTKEAALALEAWKDLSMKLALSAQTPGEAKEAFLLAPAGSNIAEIARKKMEYWEDLQKMRRFFTI
jgi:hypothetical protein